MNKRTTYFLNLMNTKNWFRMLVCFMPGIILGKLATSLGASKGITLACSVLLLFGLVIYAGWSLIRKKFDAVNNDKPGDSESTAADEGASSSEKLTEIIALCGGNEQLANNLILVECKLNPDLSYSAALDIARRRILLKNQFEN